MSGILLEVLLIVVLLVVNGVFALSEIAVVSSRKSRLRQRAEQGSASARRALELAESPGSFLATVQVGITLVGILAGAFGGATVAEELAPVVARSETLEPAAEEIAFALVVLGITYLSLVIGELVPKRIALNAPERTAALIAGPMQVLARAASPLVRVLTLSTEGVLRLLRVRRPTEPPVTEEEIEVLLQQGTEAGVFEPAEQDLVENVFWLGNQRVTAVMTPRVQLPVVDTSSDPAAMRARLLEQPRRPWLLVEGSLDRVKGVIEPEDLWAAEAAGGAPLDPHQVMREPLVIPESARALELMHRFRASGTHAALVVDEYGGVEGLVTLDDLVEDIVGSLERGAVPEPEPVWRADGSVLLDGAMAMDDVREALDLPERRAAERGGARTLGGFVFQRMGQVPRAGAAFDADGFRWEVVDMDGNRVDKVLASRTAPPIDPDE